MVGGTGDTGEANVKPDTKPVNGYKHSKSLNDDLGEPQTKLIANIC